MKNKILMLLSAVVLSGAVNTGAYAKTDELPQLTGMMQVAAAESEEDPPVKKLPYVWPSGPRDSDIGNFGVGPFRFTASGNYLITFTWSGTAGSFNMLVVGENGYEKELTLENGKAAAVSVPETGIYSLSSPSSIRNGQGSAIAFKLELSLAGEDVPEARFVPSDVLTNEQKTADLEELVEILERDAQSFERVDKKVYTGVKDDILEKIPGLSDTGFYYELCRLAALAKDAHTNVSLGLAPAIQESYLPFSIIQLGGKWYLNGAADEKYSGYLSNELTAVNGTPVREILETAKPYISHENDYGLEKVFTALLNRGGFLRHLGAVSDIEDISLTTADKTGKEIKIDTAAIPWDIMDVSIYKENAPKTRPYATDKIYEFFELNPDILFIRVNAAEYDFDYPIHEFTRQIENEIEEKKYEKVVVDMRDNEGGNPYYFFPTVYMLEKQQEKRPFKLYTLIGDSTFSSGVINAAQLQRYAGAVLVGTPTKGNVYMYGDTSSYLLANSALEVSAPLNYSDEVPGYSEAPLKPDIAVKHTIEDYIAGTDADVQAVIND